MAGYGQPSTLTDEVIAAVEKYLPTVLYIESVADYIGTDRKTLGAWVKEGRREELRKRRGKPPLEHPDKQFHRDQCYKLWMVYKKAMASGEIYSAGVIKKASEKQWQAAAWMLERRHPEKWGGDRRVIRDLERQLRKLEQVLKQATNDDGDHPTEEPEEAGEAPRAKSRGDRKGPAKRLEEVRE